MTLQALTNPYPPSWRAVSARFVVTLNPSKRQVAGRALETLVSFVPMEAVGEFGGLDTSASRPLGDVQSGYTFFRDGDVLVAKITPCFENGKGALAEGLQDGFGFGTTELHVISPSLALDSRFLFYVTISHPFRVLGQGEMFGAGGQKRVPESFLLDFPIGLPTIEEQRARAAFLDRKTAAIDDLIAKKERLIELLQQKRQALVTQAVTKGLDPNVPLKESRIASIGAVPAHWNVRRLGHLALVVRGAAPRPAGDPRFFGSEYCPWITVGELTKDDRIYVESTEEFLTAEGVAESRRIPAGTLLLTNSGASLGAPKIATFSGCINDGSIAFLSMSSQLHREYAWLYLSSLTDSFREMTWQGWGQQNLNTGIVKATRIPLPPLLEQRRIVQHVQSCVSSLVEIRRSISAQLELLREYRQAVITAAVTGKIDVPQGGCLMGKTKELHFEDAIEHHLLTAGGWTKGSAADVDRQTALVAKDLFAFIESTQPELWADLRKHHKAGLEAAVLDTLAKQLDLRGSLEVMRHGFKFYGKKIDCAYFRPAHGMNPDILAEYAKNRLVVTRQVKFSPTSEHSVDLALFVNGLPVATAELKNPLTNQTVQNAVLQYRDRDHRHALFQFKKRALVHFAVDPDLVYMTTKLAGKDTVFLPFNRGADGGAGNPAHPSGYRTGYLWQEVWQRDSFLDILGRFAHLATEEKKVDGKVVTKESIVFPRYHQLDVVRKLDDAARKEGAGHSYLIQHSAGSGKSNSIAWLAHRLSSLHDDKDEKVFDSVVVITDRRVLDQQLQANIYQFEHKQGVVQKIDENSQQLADALTSATPIIITTLQKFPFVTEKIGKLPSRRYALIVDEAHSSQTGEAARHMKEVLAAKSLEEAEQEEDKEEEDSEDRLVKVMASRGKQPNLSFFAFTATPKGKTLEVFGRRDADDKPVPFHLYSMRQAIEEGFILDVLKNYTTYKSFYRLVKATEADPKGDKRKATSQLARFMSLHPYNIGQKTQVMVEHFRSKVRHRIAGKAKAMVVTSSRLHAVRYHQAFRKYIDEQGYKDIGVLVAFSGAVEDPELEGVEYTEQGMNNGIKERELPDRFASDDYQVLLVANKYQTGFDQPLLHTMYVDKRLSGVQAVQTLSRLNRTTPGKEDTFVLDFVNGAEEIERSFQPYFEQTAVAETADPHQLYELQHRLEGFQVYWTQELETFCKYFYAPKEKQTVSDQAEMYRQLGPPVDRFNAKEEEEQAQFRNALSGYVKLYSFLSQVMPFTDPDLEKLYTFGRFLELKLPKDDKKAPLDLDGEVALKYYRLDKINEGAIMLTLAEPVAIRSPSALGSRQAKDVEAPLSEIIDVLNERFGTEFTKADQLLFDQFIQEAKQDQDVVARAMANPLDNFELAMKPKVEGLMIDRMDQNQDIVNRYLNDPAFQSAAFKALVRRIYEEVRAGGSSPPPPSG